MNLLICIDTINWCFANRALALQQNAPPDWVVDIVPYSALNGTRLETVCWDRYDLVFCIANARFKSVRERATCPVITGHNNGPGRRPELLVEQSLSADYMIVNNYLAWVGASRAMPNLPICNISNGVDLTTFTPGPPMAERPHKVLFTCSADKAQDVEDVKGYHDILTPLKILLESDGWEVEYRVVASRSGYTAQQMAQWYQSGSYVVCASKSEGTPNYLLEAMACGCVPVALPVGNVPEIVSHGVSGIIPTERNTFAMYEALKQARANRERLSAGALAAIQSWDWPLRAKHFFALFALVAAGQKPKPFTYLESRHVD